MLPFEYISDDEELKNALTTMIARCDTYLPRIVSLIIESWQNEEELTSLWISKNSLSRLSNRYLKNRYAFAEQGIALKIFKENKKDEEKVNIPAYVSLAEVKQILEHIPYEDQSSLEKDKRNYLFKPHLEEQRNGETNNRKFLISLIISDIKSYYDTPRTTTDNENNTIENNYLQEKAAIQSFLPVLDKTDTHQKTSIKNLGDQALFLLRFLKLFKVAVDKLSGEQLSEKYNDIDRIITEFSLTQQYDAIRNYLTQKPFSEEKIKLNFDCSTLLDGRDVNKENQNLGVILRENGKWFLAIMHKEYTTLFDPKKTPTLYETPDTMEKLEYKLLP
ncbi:MAG: hypothetical protein LBP53_01820 [Candidatus Peribacteria bacterium]|jgi:CRISPR-associated protein Cpf1|nr:hypothetical protein [Candidatus Peribacteria bacterium]